MLRVYLLQNWLPLRDRGIEDALCEPSGLSLFAEFSSLELTPDAATILNSRRAIDQPDSTLVIFGSVRHLLQFNGLIPKKGTRAGAVIIDTPISTKNKNGQRDLARQPSKKGKLWHLEVKAHIRVDTDPGPTYPVVHAAKSEPVVGQAADLLPGNEWRLPSDAGYFSGEKHTDRANGGWVIGQRRGALRNLADTRERACALADETRKLSIRAFVGQAFRIVTCLFGCRSQAFNGVAKRKA